LLADRPALVPPLEETLDWLNLATVLLDHADDWATDLPAGRFNAFVAHASSLEQTPSHREENERRVMRLLLLGDAGRSYYGQVRRELEAAEQASLAVSCPDLTGYIRHFQLEVERLAQEREALGQATLRQATEQLLGPRSADWPPEGDA
jgi:hypothetical protein